MLFLFSIKISYSNIWILSDTNLEVRFDDQTALLKVFDKRCNKAWEQAPFDNQIRVKKVNQKGNELTVILSGAFDFKAVFRLTEASDLEVMIQADEKMPMKELAFPAAFKTPDKNHYLLETDGEGMLLSVDDQNYPLGNGVTYFCGGGLSMAWMGVVDTKFETGYMAILETPYDAALRTKRENALVTFSPIWLSSMEKFGYKRKVTYYFFDKGGYVAQCKKYREYIWGKNQVISLKEKQKRFPELDKMIGGVHIYVWDKARKVEFAKELKSSGIEKALILWDANHTPYPEIGFDNQLKELGFATGGYELFTDLKTRDTASYKIDMNGPMRFAHTVYPGKFNELAARKSDGKTYFNQFGHTTCPEAIRPEIYRKVDAKLKEFPHETFFLDVYQANGLFECYSKDHPLTRQQFAEAVVKNHQIIEDKYKLYLGGEWGAEYVNAHVAYVHGMMTLQRTWWGSGIEKKGTIYYTGDWKSNPRPTQMVGTRVANDTYLKYSINEYTRVPLYELVYHDAVVTSWRWEDGNHHTPEIWWKKDLFNMLYGNAPLWNLDRERWEEYKNTFIDSYKKVCPWLQQIGYDELVSHSFITDDHKVQESVFSSGKKVVVNFGDTEYIFDDKTIKPKSYILN
ncbi:MAG: hypothetical protein GZ094_00015 [Mariniphaga sp.]|nr:hypothetical protein [Mariniphaga sp.]